MKKGSILIVDDDEYYLQMVEIIVEQAGVKAHYATSGEEAVAILKEGRFSTMITDLNMPGMDGYELAMIAKELFPDICIVMITGDISPDVSRRAAEAGASRVIAKPVRSTQIRKLVRDRADAAAISGNGNFQ
jgi:CheY-like chemotaxis protein